MSRRHLLAVGMLLAAAAPVSAQTVYGDAGRPDPAFAPYGLEAYRAIVDGCLPNADGRLPFTRDNAAALAAADLKREEFPPEWAIRSVSLRGGRVDYAGRPSSDGRVLLAAIPAGRLCETLLFDVPTRGRIFISLDAALRDNGWRLRRREGESLEVSRRAYEHVVPGRSPDALLDVTEFVYGGGPVRHLRLRATLKSFR